MTLRNNFYSIGFFGVPNFGDELLSYCIFNRLRQNYPSSDIYVMSLNPKVSRRYAQLEAKYVHGFWPGPGYYLHIFEHLRAVFKSKLIVIGGGGLIADYYTWSSIPRYCIEALWAILIGRNYIFVGIGVRKIKRRWVSKLAKFVCKRASVLYCRDEVSSQILKEIVGREDIRTSGDLANLGIPQLGKEYKDKNYALINFREDPPIDAKKNAEMCNELLKYTEQIVFLSVEKADTKYYKEITESWETEQKQKIQIVEPSTMNEAIRWIMEAMYIVAERLHVNLVAAKAGKNLLVINYEGKVERCIGKTIEIPMMCTLEQIGAEQVKKLHGFKQPQSFSKNTELERETKEVFDKSIEDGLAAGCYELKDRLWAAILLFLLLIGGVVWCFAIFIKKLAFKTGIMKKRK